jgi:ferritin-like metal-binding protein YciE
MEDLMLHELQDIYYAEHQITKALSKLVEKATNRDLKQTLNSHLDETKKADRSPGSGFQEARPVAQGRGLPRD